jgi:diguanylate cyclase (GGDEF)-like protein
MNEISQVARYLNDLVETAHGVMGVVLNVFGHYAAAIGIVSDDGVDLVIRSDHRLARRYVQEIRQRVQESLSSLAGLTVSGPLRLVVRDCAKGATQSAELSSLTTPLVSIPLKQRDIPLGFFFLNPRSPTGLKQVELRVLRSLVDQIAVIVENARLHQKVRRMSITDPLTGLANRQHFHDELEREFARARRYSIPFSLLMIDIDHFKVLNDSYGHQQGDLVLRELAAMLERQVRGGDLVARYGGEEFAVVLPQARPPEARAIAERVRQELEGFSFPGLPHPISVTVSIGVASFPSPLVAAPDDLVRRADVFLYQAKRGGRNQVQVEAGEISTDAPGGENTPPSAAGSRA